MQQGELSIQARLRQMGWNDDNTDVFTKAQSEHGTCGNFGQLSGRPSEVDPDKNGTVREE
jgi:hypothetical protein